VPRRCRGCRCCTTPLTSSSTSAAGSRPPRCSCSSAQGEVAGFAILNGDELDGFYVAPEHQRAGVGAALFRHVQEQCPERFGFWVFRDDARARRFYESHGAEALYETDGSNNEEGAPDVRYEWRPLPSPAEAEA
jgi:ribosomal protein S18 acetylase RimI-like enzyme